LTLYRDGKTDGTAKALGTGTQAISVPRFLVRERLFACVMLVSGCAVPDDNEKNHCVTDADCNDGRRC
jgi:hypothetical protein